MKKRKPTTVVHVKKDEFDVYIGRPSPWGNPFAMGKQPNGEVWTRQRAIAEYRRWLLHRPELIKAAKRELKGKRLGCWCKPKCCHGDVWAEILDHG